MEILPGGGNAVYRLLKLLNQVSALLDLGSARGVPFLLKEAA